MRVRSLSLRLTLFLIAAALGPVSVSATSSGKNAAASPTACAVSAKFVTTKLEGGKVFWVFDRLGSAADTRCSNLARTFEVFVPSGSYSRLADAYIYPVSITEPKAGAEIDLRLESVAFKAGPARWLIAGDSDAFRVRR